MWNCLYLICSNYHEYSSNNSNFIYVTFNFSSFLFHFYQLFSLLQLSAGFVFSPTPFHLTFISIMALLFSHFFLELSDYIVIIYSTNIAMPALMYAFPRINFYIKFKTTCKIGDTKCLASVKAVGN